MSVTGIGLILVFISDILMIAIQTIRLETSPVDVIQTYFGTIWLARMIITIILLRNLVWNRQKKIVIKKKPNSHACRLICMLIATSSMIGHGAASEETAALVLDYVHNLVAAVWIGGIFLFCFYITSNIFSSKRKKAEKK